MGLIKVLRGNAFFIIFIVAIIWLFFPFLAKGQLPIPSDTIVGLYHPFRDFYSSEYPNGIPFKNFLVTDPVRQTFIWKNLSIEKIANFQLPLWNPYEMAGKPLLANFQSSAFYPLNLILFIKPFYLSWSIFIVLQPLLAGIFLYLYLNNLNLNRRASVLGAIVFSFSGFFVSWLEWGTVLHTALWLPLILLSTDKVFSNLNLLNDLKFKIENLKLEVKIKKYLVWSLIFTFSVISSFLAGHLQVFFYLLILSVVYIVSRWFQYERKIKFLFIFAFCYLIFTIITSVQWLPTLQLILLSARGADQIYIQNEGWFIPWQNLLQFFVPDFFGNPATLNYWGVFNYAEFVGYIGIVPLIFAMLALFLRIDRKTLFFGMVFFASLLFSLPTPFAIIPYKLAVPFLSTSQPTRLLFVTCFSLAVLASLGFDLFLKNNKKVILPLSFICLVFILIWIYVLFGGNFLHLISLDNLSVTRRNILLPSVIFLFSSVLIYVFKYIRNKGIREVFVLIFLLISCFDLLRFAIKFEPFAKKDYLFPTTKAIEFLKTQKGIFRVLSQDSRIFPPNFSTYYKIQSVEGYDPLYLLSFGELIAASERNKGDISAPFGFNRIITPHNIDSKLIDLLNVRYILSLSDISSKNFKKVFHARSTRMYENKNYLPRAFFVNKIIFVNSKQEEIDKMFLIDLRSLATINKKLPSSNFTGGKAEIISYNENNILIKTKSEGESFLILTDIYYPTWRVLIDGKSDHIYKVDYAFRGIVVPRGEHEIKFYDSG